MYSALKTKIIKKISVHLMEIKMCTLFSKEEKEMVTCLWMEYGLPALSVHKKYLGSILNIEDRIIELEGTLELF